MYKFAQAHPTVQCIPLVLGHVTYHGCGLGVGELDGSETKRTEIGKWNGFGLLLSPSHEVGSHKIMSSLSRTLRS